MPRARSAGLQGLDVAAVAGSRQELHVLALEVGLAKQGFGQLTNLGGVSGVAEIEVVAEHDIVLLHGLGKDAVVVELRADHIEAIDEILVTLQLALGELLQSLQARALVGFRKHDIETDQLDLVLLKQAVEQMRELVARPRPATLGREAGLVDIDDHHAVVYGARHGELKVPVVGKILHLLDEVETVGVGGVH